MKTQRSPVKIAIVGCGAITDQSYLPVLSRMSEFEVVALVDLDVERARTLAQRYGIPHYSKTADEVAALAEAGVVAVANCLHHEVSCDLMKRGLHVFCEKPMATTKARAEAMVRWARENGVILNVGNIRRFYWVNRRVKELVDSQELGRLLSFHIEEGFIHNWPTTSGFYFDKAKSGGGILVDTGAHVLDLLLWWIGHYPTCISYKDDNFGSVEAECHLELEFKESVGGSVTLSRLRRRKNAYSLTFENGTLSFEPYDPSGICNAIRMEQNDTIKVLKAPKAMGFGHYFKQQLAAFFRGIRGRVPSGLDPASVLPSIQLIEECYQKATRLQLPWLNHRASPINPGLQCTDLRQAKILITGASGFIGGRIAERLYFDFGNVPRCLVRNFNKLARLSRFPVEIVVGDVLDYDSLSRAVAGCDAIVHCAYGNTEDDELNVKINIQGTENLIRAALQNQIKRFVYLSSVEVYGSNQPSFVDEGTETNGSANTYGSSKLEAEKLCLQYFTEKAFPVVILRLAVVYGPHAPIWTEAVVRRLLDRGFCLSDQFSGICNSLYIDDCVDAIFVALTRDDAIGETFIISGGEKLTWNQYYAKYNEILGMPPLKTVGRKQLQFYRAVRKMFDVGYNYLRPKYGNEMFFTYSRLRETGRLPNLKAFLQKGSLLDGLDVFSRPAYYSIEKAKRNLGFEPRYNFEAGMELVNQWLRPTSRRL